MIMNRAKDIRLGSRQIDKVMQGSQLIWQNSVLPHGYTECEYLESTGTQWVDTGLITTNYNFSTVLDYTSLKQQGTSFQVPLGVSDISSGEYGWYFYIGTSLNCAFRNTSLATTNTGKNIYSGDRHVYLMDNQGLCIDDVRYRYTRNTTYNNEKTLWLYGRDSVETGLYALASGRIHSFIAYNGIEKIAEYIPCLDSNGTPCFYDTVSKQTFYNSGKGEFLYKVKGT